MLCTWKGCDQKAVKPQIGKDGSMWANLCYTHAEELDKALVGPVAQMLKCWILANGGAKALAGKM